MSLKIIGPVHYRLVDRVYENGIRVQIEQYKPIKETACGWWVLKPHAPKWWTIEQLKSHKLIKWVSKTSAKRLCYPTLELAINSFTRRKESQLSRLTMQLEQAQKVCDNLSVLKDVDLDQLIRGWNVGMTKSMTNLVWDY